MSSKNTRNKRTTTKGERLNWSELNSAQTVKLSREVVVGRLLSKAELKNRSNSNSLKSNVLVR
jgi:hypothetical protein